MKNINLIRSIAWSFHRTTGIDYQELFSEACVGYYEAVQMYNKKRNCKLTSLAYTLMQNKLKLFCATEQKHRVTDFPEGYDSEHYPLDPFEERIREWPPDCRQLAEIILNRPAWFIAETPNFQRKKISPKSTKGRIRKYLRDKGWEEDRIQNTMQEIAVLI